MVMLGSEVQTGMGSWVLIPIRLPATRWHGRPLGKLNDPHMIGILRLEPRDLDMLEDVRLLHQIVGVRGDAYSSLP